MKKTQMGIALGVVAVGISTSALAQHRIPQRVASTLESESYTVAARGNSCIREVKRAAYEAEINAGTHADNSSAVSSVKAGAGYIVSGIIGSMVGRATSWNAGALASTAGYTATDLYQIHSQSKIYRKEAARESAIQADQALAIKRIDAERLMALHAMIRDMNSTHQSTAVARIRRDARIAVRRMKRLAGRGVQRISTD